MAVERLGATFGAFSSQSPPHGDASRCESDAVRDGREKYQDYVTSPPGAGPHRAPQPAPIGRTGDTPRVGRLRPSRRHGAER